MTRRRPSLRTLGILFILAWTLVPLYWTLNSSLQTDAQITSKPSHYLPPTPSLEHYTSLLLGSGDVASAIRRSTMNIFVECAAATVVTVALATLAA